MYLVWTRLIAGELQASLRKTTVTLCTGSDVHLFGHLRSASLTDDSENQIPTKSACSARHQSKTVDMVKRPLYVPLVLNVRVPFKKRVCARVAATWSLWGDGWGGQEWGQGHPKKRKTRQLAVVVSFLLAVFGHNVAPFVTKALSPL